MDSGTYERGASPEPEASAGDSLALAEEFAAEVAGEEQGEGAPEAPRVKKRRYTLAESRVQEQLIRQLLIRGITSPEQHQEAIARATGIRPSNYRVRQIAQRVYDKWSAEGTTHAHWSKGRAVRRLIDHIARASGRGRRGDPDYIRPDYNAVARLEELLAKIEGTMEPTRVQVDVNSAESMLHVVSTMTPEQIQAAIAEQREVEALAAEARARKALAPAADAEIIRVEEAAE